MRSKVRVGIFGSYDASSQGDLAILEGILAQLVQRLPGSSATVFAFASAFIQRRLEGRFSEVEVVPGRPGHRSSPESASEAPRQTARKGFLAWAVRKGKGVATRWSLLYDLYLLSRHWRFWVAQFRRVQSLDVLLIGGGGLVADLYPKWPIYPLLYVALARLARTPVMFYAVGVGPLRRLRGKIYFTLALNLSHKVTVRDHRSFVRARKLLLDSRKLHQTADPAFYLSAEDLAVESQAVALSFSHSQPRVGVSTVSLYRPGHWPVAAPELYARYTQQMALLVAEMCNTFSAEVVLFSTNCPQDILTAQDILQAALPRIQRGRAEVLSSCELPVLSRLFPTLDAVVGTRMHSLILSAVYRVPCVALAYQEKVEALCESLNMATFSFPIKRFLQQDDASAAGYRQEVLAKVRDILRRPAYHRALVETGVRGMRACLDRDFQLLLDILQKPGD